MADSWFTLDVADQKAVLRTAATTLGKQSSILEKDIWLCWVLQVIFTMPDAHPMTFKGGTSLSKVYGIIDRFSEDVDITLDYRHFQDEFDPFADGASKSQIRKFSDRLKAYVTDYANNTVKPCIEQSVQSLGTADRHEITIDETGEKIWFSYPSVVEEADEYLKSHVLIELGGRNVIDPNEVHNISPELADFARGLEFPQAEVTVLSPSRTFWEKATLIHVECNRGRIQDSPERLSRHWYDISRLAHHDSGVKAVNDRGLFEDVIRHKKVFFNAGYANYDECLQGRLRLLPDEDALSGLKADYQKMLSAGMMYGSPLTFDEIIDTIRETEERINQWS